jgi:hypothetical protein
MERSEYKQIAEVLGGQKVFGRSRWSSLWWTVQIEKGLPFDARVPQGGLSAERQEICCPGREHQDRLALAARRKSRLPVSASDRIYRFARLFALAEHVLKTRTRHGSGCMRNRWGWAGTPDRTYANRSRRARGRKPLIASSTASCRDRRARLTKSRHAKTAFDGEGARQEEAGGTRKGYPSSTCPTILLWLHWKRSSILRAPP